MLRQFTQFDTLPWSDQYGNGSSGALSLSGGLTLGSSQSANYFTITGSLGALVGNTSAGDGVYNLPCKIIQMQNLDGTPNWEYNVLINIASGIAHFKYPLTRNYAAPSQIVTSGYWSSVTVGAVTISVPAWNGSTGGVGFLLTNGAFSNAGTLNATGLGFRGGQTVGVNNVGFTGEGTLGPSVQMNAQNGNGGGGGGWSDNYPWNQGNGGGGGGNFTPGSQGIGTGGGNNVHGPGGLGGLATTTSNGQFITLGGGGGSGGMDNPSGSPGTTGPGGIGGGIWDIVCITYIETGSGQIQNQGTSGSSSNYTVGAGGSAAGGYNGIKCQSAVFLGNGSTSGGPRVRRDGVNLGDSDGAPGGLGLTHVDYLGSVTSSIPGGFSASQDYVLQGFGNALGFGQY